MTSDLFIPPPTYIQALELKSPIITLRELCERAGVPCKASGAFTERKLQIVVGDELKVLAEPGDWGNVKVTLKGGSNKNLARDALKVLAYGLHDVVAKESIRGEAWAKPRARIGRPRSAKPLSNKERQRRFRERLSLKKEIPQR